MAYMNLYSPCFLWSLVRFVMVMASSQIDIEELICAIQARPALWMSKHSQHKHKKVILRLWNEIKSLFPGHEVSQIKKKWKNVKDHYKKEVKKVSANKSGMGGESVKSSWQYFELMTFLNDDKIPEPTEVNLDSDNDDEGDNDNASEDTDHMTDMSHETATTASYSSRRKNKSATETRKEFLKLGNKKLKLLETKYDNNKRTGDIEKDDDYHFFMSLIPQMKNFNNIQKLRIRNKISTIILNEAERCSYIPSHSRDVSINHSRALISNTYGEFYVPSRSRDLTSTAHLRDLTPNTYGYHTSELEYNFD